MNKIKKTAQMFVLAVFVFGTAFVYTSAEAKPMATLTSTQASNQLSIGSLVKIKNRNGAAVYQIGSDGKKYIFPDQKTFMTWHENFNDVVEVDQETLDSYEDGGAVPFQAGVKLVTHPCTAKVYAVGLNGQVVHIPDEATAEKFYGKAWKELIDDVDCGLFAVSYQPKAGVLSEDNLPDGTITQDEDTNELYYLENGLKRKVKAQAMKQFMRKLIVRVKNKLQNYQDGDDVDTEEEDVVVYDPRALGREKVLVCHNGKTIRIAKPALQAHLNRGATEGRCNIDNEDDNSGLPVCDHNGDGIRNLVDLAMFAQCKGTYDANGDGAHTLADYALYAQNHNDDTWCKESFVCDPNEDEPEESLAVCDHNDDGVVNLTDVVMFADCRETFDVNGDGIHNLTDVTLYSENHTDAAWCSANFVCEVEADVVDLEVIDISVTPSSPEMNEEVDIKISVKNSGNVTITDGEPFFHYLRDFDGLWQSSESLPSISTNSPAVLPGDILYYHFYGKWDPAGEKDLSFTIDGTDVLSESDETNNSMSVTINVSEEESLAVCDHNGDGLVNLTDVTMFTDCQSTFDVNGDGIHNLTDVTLYSENHTDAAWCSTNFVCEVEAESAEEENPIPTES